jgi:hypothetical protein
VTALIQNPFFVFIVGEVWGQRDIVALCEQHSVDSFRIFHLGATDH